MIYFMYLWCAVAVFAVLFVKTVQSPHRKRELPKFVPFTLNVPERPIALSELKRAAAREQIYLASRASCKVCKPCQGRGQHLIGAKSGAKRSLAPSFVLVRGKEKEMTIYKMYGALAGVGDYADLIADKPGIPRVCVGVNGGARRYERVGDGWVDVSFPAPPSTAELKEALATLNNVAPEDIQILPQTLSA